MSIQLQRLRYRQGQLLRSRDFRDQTYMAAHLRWWHNRALHDSFGVSSGFFVTRVPETGVLKAVKVGCGKAYDCFGRELILQNSVEIEVPALEEGCMTLLVAYKETADFSQRHEIGGVCLTGEAPLAEEPDIFWKPTASVTPWDGVPLAKVNEGKLELMTPPLVRPLARPHMAAGATIPGNTAWELWRETETGPGKEPIDIGFEVKIDTSAAGFTAPPCYFATLQGSLWSGSPEEFILIPFTHIAEPSNAGFTFRLWLPEFPIARAEKPANLNFINNFPAFARKQGLFVSWLGIEPKPVPAEK